MYHAVGKNTDKQLLHTVYISGPYLEEVFKWLAKEKKGGQTKLIINPVPTSTVTLQAGRHTRTATWSVSEVCFRKNRNCHITDWKNHQHEIDLEQLNVIAELNYHGLDVYKCISYAADGSPRLIKDFMMPQPAVSRESAHIPLALIKLNQISPPHVPAVVKSLHPYADNVLEVSAWKKRTAALLAPHTSPRKRPDQATIPSSPASSPAKKSKRTTLNKRTTATVTSDQPSASSFFQPQAVDTSGPNSIIDIIQRQAASSSVREVPDDDQVTDLLLQLENIPSPASATTTEGATGEEDDQGDQQRRSEDEEAT